MNTGVAEKSKLAERFDRLGQSALYSEAHLEKLSREFDEINTLKREKNAVILAHNYQRPEILEVADFVGDSLELARKAIDVDAEVIVFCGVHFMAETAKICNPDKKVILPNLAAGCTLAEAADAGDVAERVAELRKAYPDVAVVSYVNTTAAVKAVTDVCVTSSNAVHIVNSLPNSTILFLPDRNLAAYVAQNTDKRIIAWDGDCYVHHQINPEEVLEIKNKFPGAEILAHPECRADVLSVADAVLSTSGMITHAKESSAKEFIVVTECGLSDRLMMEVPEKRFYKGCNLCRYMKMITLRDTKRSLERLAPEIHLSPEIIAAARKSIDRMLEMSS